ncbi:MAG: ABC transporter ATP-binding protein [Actinobacteria bacterium]|nr:MAG: ABC transporter ATP-binding protein [Actinomycetota bacterium]
MAADACSGCRLGRCATGRRLWFEQEQRAQGGRPHHDRLRDCACPDDEGLGAVGSAGRGDIRRDGRHPRQPGVHSLPRRGFRVLDEVPGGVGAARDGRACDLPRQEQHRSSGRHSRCAADCGKCPCGSRPPGRSACSEPPAAADGQRRACLQGRVHDGERTECSDGEARDVDGRPLLPLARRRGGDRRSRYADRCRQRRCLSVDDRELPVAIASLWREPERREQPSFGALEFHDVFKIYRSGPVETVALRGLDLRVEPREFVAVFGPSGSGKSTMLHLAAGLDEPSAGDVRVFGRSLALLDENELAAFRAREAAIVFQTGNLWPGLSVRENVDLALRLARGKRVDNRVERALDVFGLSRRERTRAGALSGGEQQRVAIAAAAARESPLVLADEPTAELDERNERIVLEALARLRSQFGSTVVVVTHSPRVADAVDRVIELRDGRAA